MLRRIGAASLIGRKYRTLSQGEKRAIIARSLMEEPNLLIFDETSSGLDLFAQEAIFQLIQQIKADGKGAEPFCCHPPCRGNHQVF